MVAPETQVEGERLPSICGNMQAIGRLKCGRVGGSTLTAMPVSTRKVR